MKAVWVAILVSASLSVAGLVYAAYSNGQKSQDVQIELNTKHTTNTRLDIKTIQADLGHIKDDIKDSKIVQERIFTKLDAMSNN